MNNGSLFIRLKGLLLHVAYTSPISCLHVADILPTRRRHLAYTSPSSCLHVGKMLSIHIRKNKNGTTGATERCNRLCVNGITVHEKGKMELLCHYSSCTEPILNLLHRDVICCRREAPCCRREAPCCRREAPCDISNAGNTIFPRWEFSPGGA